MKLHNYNARWATPGQPSIANVSFTSSHDANAKRQADKIARDLNVTRTPRTITCDGKVVECINSGTSD